MINTAGSGGTVSAAYLLSFEKKVDTWILKNI